MWGVELFNEKGRWVWLEGGRGTCHGVKGRKSKVGRVSEKSKKRRDQCNLSMQFWE